MGQFQQQAAVVARRQEARQAGRHHHRVAHQHVGLGLPHGASDQTTAISRTVPLKAGRSKHHGAGVPSAPPSAGRRKGHQLLGRRRASCRCSVAASPPERTVPIAPGHAVDQPAVEVADADAQPALAEVVACRVGAAKPVMFRMPTSTAAMVAKAVSPSATPSTRSATGSGARGSASAAPRRLRPARRSPGSTAAWASPARGPGCARPPRPSAAGPRPRHRPPRPSRRSRAGRSGSRPRSPRPRACRSAGSTSP
jgi:hypothetical protein